MVHRGCLSDRTHQFLHGRPADVPGSWIGDGPACGSESCVSNAEPIAEDNTAECEFCREERQRRQMVAEGPEDERFMWPDFVRATAVFPNQGG